MPMQKKPWMTSFLFKEIVFFFKKFVQGRISFTSRHLLFLDGHDSQCYLRSNIRSTRDGLKHDHPTIPHITCFPTIKYIFCFKPLETTFKTFRNVVMFINNHMEPNNITLVGCVD